MGSCSVPMGTLIRDCNPTAQVPIVPKHRQAGATVYCKIKKDSTRLMWDYCDCRGAYISYDQVDVRSGRKQVNVQWSDAIESVQARAIVAWDRNEQARWGDFNRTCFLNEARASLHHWYHVGLPFEHVPGLNFEPSHTPKWGLYLFRLMEEFNRLSADMLAGGDNPPLGAI